MSKVYETVEYKGYTMQVEKVQSATVLYLIFGIINIAVLIFGLIVVPQAVMRDHEYGIIPILMIPLILSICMILVFLTSYRNRKEFCIFSLEKKGSINFDELSEEFMQVKDEPGVMYFIKKEDHSAYNSYAIMNVSK